MTEKEYQALYEALEAAHKILPGAKECDAEDAAIGIVLMGLPLLRRVQKMIYLPILYCFETDAWRLLVRAEMATLLTRGELRGNLLKRLQHTKKSYGLWASRPLSLFRSLFLVAKIRLYGSTQL
jgi:hypothetical protein